jgi:hypothetical protein
VRRGAWRLHGAPRNAVERRGSERGRGDPGDEIWRRLAALGFEGVDYDGGEDLELGRARQLELNAADARKGLLTWRPLVADGVCGPASIAAMRRHGFKRWRDVGVPSERAEAAGAFERPRCQFCPCIETTRRNPFSGPASVHVRSISTAHAGASLIQ